MFMPNVAVRFATSAVVLATVVAAAAQPLHAAPLSQADPRVLCVNINGGATGAPCTNSEAYTTIQAAVDAAQSGDEIRIAKGVYTAYSANNHGSVISIIDKSLKFVGGFGNDWITPGSADHTVIDGEGRRRGIKIQGADIKLEGLTITRGRALREGVFSYSEGGGIYGSTGGQTISLSHVVLYDNLALHQGGGIYAFDANVVMIDTQVLNNRADGAGGGIMAGQVQMLRSIVDGNSARGISSNSWSSAGGVFGYHVQLVDSVVTNNTGLYGGGVFASTTVIERTRIEGNHATCEGGGLHVNDKFYNQGQAHHIINSVISNNTTDGVGGGLYASGVNLDIISSVVSNNIAGTAGDAIYTDDGLTYDADDRLTSLRNVTIASTERAPHEAIMVQGMFSDLWLMNTAIVNHEVGIARNTESSLWGNYNAFFANGTDQMVDGTVQPVSFPELTTVDPQFVDPAAGNFHLQSTSPLIDQGDSYRIPDDQRDIDGEPVPYGPRGDIGADEWTPAYLVFGPLVAR